MMQQNKLEDVVSAFAIEQSKLAALVRRAAERVGYNDATGLLNRMEAECVKEVWQLMDIRAQDWQVMGAPVGVSVAIRAEITRTEVKRGAAKGWPTLRKWADDRKKDLPEVKLGNGVLSRFWMEVQLLWRMGRLCDYVLPRDHQEVVSRPASSD